MGLVGKSGSGKSTIIKAILGINPPDDGRIWMEVDKEEIDISASSGYSPQDNSLYPFMSIQENLQTFGKLRGLGKNEIGEKSEKLLKKLEIFDDRHKRISNLSGGMEKRADLAVALLHSPQLLILDEPFTGIDPPQRQIIWEVLRRLADDGKIIILTSHLIKDVAERCNDYGLVHDGEFYHTYQIKEMMEDTDYKSIEQFLNDVFRF